MDLYIDTHFVDLVIALVDNGQVICKRILKSNKHSENTINLLKDILDSNKVSFDDINEVIVINGPGSFTGVRIGVVIAKIIGFTKNIKVKAISYLQAQALSYDKEITLGLRDKNGVFGAKFDNNHEVIGDYFYLTNKEFLERQDNIIINEDEVDISKVVQFLQGKEAVNPHLLKPLYVKKIEVQND